MQAVILAAGESSRFWPLASDQHKAMYKILGKPILQYTLEALQRLNIRDILLVHSAKDCSIKKYFGDGKKFKMNIQHIVQPKAEGAADAILRAKNRIAGDFVVLNASNFTCATALIPLLKKRKLKNINEKKRNKNIGLACVKTNQPSLYGIFKFEKTKRKTLPVGLIEKPESPQSNQRIIGVYILTKEFLQFLSKQKGHYALESALNAWMKNGNPTTLLRLSQYPELPLKYPWHLFAINKALMEKMKSHKGKNVKIDKTAKIEGKVWIGNNVTIMEYAIIKGPCYLGDKSIVGTHSLLRQYTSLGKKVHTGYHTELKNTIIYDNANLHTCFLGDTILDEGCSFGAGTITANRRIDRKSVFSMVKGEMVSTDNTFCGTICGKNARTGIHTSFMPGVKIGKGGRVGPNTLVLEDVPDDTTFYTEFRRVVKKRR